MVKQKQAMSRSYLVVMAAGLITTCLGLLVMVGWYSHNLTLIQIFPPIPYMRYNTALAFFLSGLALITLARKRYKISRWLGIVVGAIGFLTLFQYVFHIDLGIDQLLMKDYLSSTAPRSSSSNTINYSSQFFIHINKPLPGRLSPNTAFSFTLMGAALFLLSRARKLRKTSLIAGIFGVIIGAMGVIALLGYFTGVVTAYSWGYSLGVALHTALGLLVLSVGIMTLALSTRWHRQGDELRTRRDPNLPPEFRGDLGGADLKTRSRGVLQRTLAIANLRNWSIEQKTLAGLSLAAVVLVGSNVFSYWSFVNYKETSSALVTENRKVLEKIDTILSKLKDAETGQRGYIITGRKDYLKSYNQATQNINPQLRELQTLTLDSPSLATMRSLVAQKLAELNETIELRRNRGFAAAQQVVQTDRVKIIMDRIRSLTEEMKQDENERLKQRLEASRDNISTQNFLSIGIVLTFCLFYLVYYILNQENIKRNQALEAAQESELRFRTMADHAPVMLGVTDTMGRCIFANQSWLDFTGSTLANELDDGWADHVHPDDKQYCLETYQTAFNARESFEMEYRLKTYSGEYRWILNRGAPRWLPDGSFVGYIGSSVDINDTVVAARQRQEALLDLQHSEQRYRSLLTATTQIIWTTNAQGEVIDDMPGWGQITGQSAEEMKGWGWLSVIHPDDQELTSRLWNQAVQTRSLYEIEHRLRTVDGSYRDFSVCGVPVLDDNGEILEWVGTHTDITEQKQAESQLQRSHNLLQTVIEGTSDAIFAKDLQGRFMLANSMTAAIMGKPVEEILNKDDRDMFPAEIARMLRETDRHIMTTGENQVLEEEVWTNGNLRTYLSAKSVWRDAQGNVVGLVGISRDITERKLAEQEIKKLNGDLERRVIERTAELTAANKELEAFSYSVSHDLRAPLRGIDGFSQALIDRYSEQLDDKGKHYLSRIRVGTQRMGELIDDLLTLSRVTRTEMRRKEVDLSAIATEIITELQQLEPQRQLEFAIAPGLIAHGDSQLLRVVLENLLNNAWKFTSARIQTKIEFDAILQEDGNFAYFVRDDGAGFDMTYVNKLFGAFQRLHSTTQFPGTGIGLATVQRIINRHGGKVWAEGAVEQGATFYFTL